MKNTKLFQYIVIGSFVFFIVVGAILFSTFRSDRESEASISVTIWGTLPLDSFSSFASKYFSEMNLKYAVNYVEKDTITFDRELVEALASGAGPDAIVLPEELIVRYRDKVYPIPYVTLPELTFKQTFIQEGELYLNNDGVLALPLMVDPLVMYWNRDIFNNVGVTAPPTTWAEILALVSKMTKKDQSKNILSSTVAMGEFRNVNNAKEILSALLIQAGNPIVSLGSEGALVGSLDKDFGLQPSPAIRSLEYFTNFSNPNRNEYSWNRAMPGSRDSFANGDLAMYFGFASEFTKIKNLNPNLNFTVALLPQKTKTNILSTYGDIYALAIMKKSLNPAGTYTVISTLTSATAVPYWKDIFNLPSARRDILGQTETNAAKMVFNRSAILSKGWLDPNKSQTSTIFQDMIESYTTGRASLSGAVSTASDQLDNLLGSN